MNSPGIQQASRTTLNTDSLGTQVSQPSVNTGKTLNTMPVHQNTTDADSSTNVMNRSIGSNPSILINLNNGVQSAATLNQLVNNKTLPVDTSKTVGPADVEVTEQSFSVIIQPVQTLDPPPPVQNFNQTPELENVQVKIEESSVVDELQSSIPMSEEGRVENSLVAKGPNEDLTDNSSKDKMNETGFKFFKCGICDEGFSDSLDLETHVRQHKIFQSEIIKCGYCEESFSFKTDASHHLRCIHGIICEKPKVGMEEVNLPTYESEGKSVKIIRVIQTKIPKCGICGRIFQNLESFTQHKKNSSCAYVWYCCVSCGQPVGKETREEVPLSKELICKLCHKSGNQSKELICNLCYKSGNQPKELICNLCHQSGNQSKELICNLCHKSGSQPKENTDTIMQQNKQGNEMILGLVQPSIVGSGCNKCRKKEKNKQGDEMILGAVQPSIVGSGFNKCRKKEQSKKGDEMILDAVSYFVSCDSKHADQNKQGDEMMIDAVQQPSNVPLGGKTCKKKVKEFYNCLDCRKSFTKKCSYVMHLKMSHSTAKQYKCDLCERAYMYPTSLRLHKLSHSSMETFACDKCPKTFKLKEVLKRHQRVHEPARFPCDVCGKKLRWKSRFIEHKRLHSGEKPFLCEVCGKRFHSWMSRFSHMDTHNSSSKRLCEICGKLYMCASSLRLHQIRHKINNSSSVEEKLLIVPWVCKICGKGFCKRLPYEKHKLNVHESKNKSGHLEEKIPDSQIRCDICGKSFSTRWTLLSHIALHKGLMWTACEKCNMVMHKHSLKRHMLRMHRTNV
ncbi:zinc finger protein 569-like isoform X2 [Saccostrea echinata]|uniref:zinc finger protein 569-like isoform X2 n=1 Tax=Saccostrea echinata TaxID=191078 RepID=UPI002A804280|nr:zinc finger protein 569-like isoform X2 [Saccostrea echinata]